MNAPEFVARLDTEDGVAQALRVAVSLGIDPNMVSSQGHFRVVRHGTAYYAEYLTPDTWGPRMPKGSKLSKGFSWLTKQLLDCRTPVDPQRLKEVLE